MLMQMIWIAFLYGSMLRLLLAAVGNADTLHGRGRTGLMGRHLRRLSLPKHARSARSRSGSRTISARSATIKKGS
jgi:hypothetical protein